MLIHLVFAPLALALTLYNGTRPTSTSSIAPSSSVVPGAPVPVPVYTGLAAYDPLKLIPPAPPSPPTTRVDIGIPRDPNKQGYPLSIKQRGNFLGFSIELSVATTIMGQAPTRLKPVFLNYMANIRNRAGAGPVIRVGGNTQEKSTIFANGLPEGGSIQKIKESNTPTHTPTISYSPDLLWTLANVSRMVDAEWYFGLAFNQSSAATISDNMPLAAGFAQKILGKNLRGLALGNEPDLYSRHGKRAAGWSMADYVTEFNTARSKIMANHDVTTPQTLLGPSVCCSVEGFGLGDVLATSWLSDNIDYLAAVTVQRYPANNCKINGNIVDPQAIFPYYLNHTGVQTLTAEYLAGSATALARGKEMLMLEFNTASCGGFPGVSDSFGAAMWLADWALQLAWGNFSTALMHVGGQNVYYNPFTPPPFDADIAKQWTTGSIYYSTLLVAEAFGRSGNAQVIDLLPDAQDRFHPTYVVYEGGAPARVVLFNYVSDASGASTYNAVISLSDLVRVPPPPPPPPAAPAPNTGTGTGAPADTGAGTPPNTDTGAGAANPNANADPNANGNAGADPNANANAGADPNANANAGADPNANANAGAAPADTGAQAPPTKRAPLATTSVFVRYLRAPSVAEQYNITWAGQTLGASFASDGRMYGALETAEYLCTDGVCTVPVPAPAIALVFLTKEAMDASTPPPDAQATFATTALGVGTAIVDLSGAQATGNGYWPGNHIYGAGRAQAHVGVGMAAVALAAAWVLARV